MVFLGNANLPECDTVLQFAVLFAVAPKANLSSFFVFASLFFIPLFPVFLFHFAIRFDGEENHSFEQNKKDPQSVKRACCQIGPHCCLGEKSRPRVC
jgi:hypothetical protein